MKKTRIFFGALTGKPLKFPKAVVLNAVVRRKRAQMSADERKRTQTQVRKRAQKSAKGRKRAQKCASAKKLQTTSFESTRFGNSKKPVRAPKALTKINFDRINLFPVPGKRPHCPPQEKGLLPERGTYRNNLRWNYFRGSCRNSW